MYVAQLVEFSVKAERWVRVRLGDDPTFSVNQRTSLAAPPTDDGRRTAAAALPQRIRCWSVPSVQARRRPWTALSACGCGARRRSQEPGPDWVARSEVTDVALAREALGCHLGVLPAADSTDESAQAVVVIGQFDENVSPSTPPLSRTTHPSQPTSSMHPCTQARTVRAIRHLSVPTEIDVVSLRSEEILRNLTECRMQAIAYEALLCPSAG